MHYQVTNSSTKGRHVMQIEMLEPPALAAELIIPEATLAQWRYRGVGPAYVKVGKHVRYRRADIDAWLNTQTFGGTAA
jgi:predicted DNA-binding transcriptional regulator AlpA